MDFLKPSRKRTIFSETLYVLLNVAMAAAIFGVVIAVNSPLPAFLLVALSKWRIFAVRPQYWYANLQSNLVDITVSLSFVVFLYTASGELYVQIALTALYIIWLLFLKPQSKRKWVVSQAGVGIFTGVTALMHVSSSWWSVAVVALMWLIGYSHARHVLTSYREVHLGLLSLIWGLVVAEIGWLLYHWNFAYEFGSSDLKISQAGVIVLLLSFIAMRGYNSIHEHKTLQSGYVMLPATLAIISIILSLTIFGSIEGV